MGDIVSVNEEKSAYEVKHEKLNVILNIEKVTKHVSHFEFEEEYEEIHIGMGKTEKEIRKNIDGIIKGQQNAYHIINNYKSNEFSQDYYIVNFKDIFSVPVTVARATAHNNGKRLRLCPPYREHLSQAFARYFMRVGLPINIHID